ncbi:MAG: aspartate/glutamate racemase family protein [Chloroflexi bacterium]|nr:aspartate/glutamate racemase family protein [Chloroflexota bacterium]
MAERYRVGFMCPPTDFDTSPTTFLRLAPEGVEVMQTQMRVAGMGHTMATFSLEAIEGAIPELTTSAEWLADAGAQVIVQYGVPFSLVHGSDAHAAEARVAKAAGVPVVLAGAAMLQAAAHLGCQRIAVAAGYFDDMWTPVFREKLRNAGLDIPYMENWVAQGVFSSQAESDRVAWDYEPEPAEAGILRAAEAMPDADAIFALGGGVRTIDIAAKIESRIGKPVIGADVAMYWRAFQHLGLRPREHGHGWLLDSLG